MKKFNELFAEYVTKLLNSADGNTIIFFKGFSISQIDFIIHHSSSILCSDSIIKENRIDLSVVNDSWLDIAQNISLANKPLIGFYEELIAIKDLLPKLKAYKIFVVNNNAITPWEPCIINNHDALALFDYLQQDLSPRTEWLSTLSQYYGDVKILDDNHILLLPFVVDNDIVENQNMWDTAFAATESICSLQTINFNSDESLQYKLDILEDNASPASFVYDDKALSPNQCAFLSLLNELDIPFSLLKEQAKQDFSQLDPDRFLPLLKKHWGENAEFRMLQFYKDPDRSNETTLLSQGTIISEIVAQSELSAKNEEHSDIFITAPTGAGKSLLFQLPALFLANTYGYITIVVSPLIALMNDQVNQLVNDRNVDAAAYINSTMSIDERISVIDKIHQGKISLLYLAPELLLTTHIQTFLGGRKIGLFVIDEAHTVTSWGRDFRSDYWFLGDFIKKCKRDNLIFPILCLTATAVYSGKDDVVNDTINELGLERVIIHLGNVKRTNISFDICLHSTDNIKTKLETEKINLTLSRIKKYVSENEKVLAYFPFRRQVDTVHSILTNNEKLKIRRYHGKLSSFERHLVEKDYKSGTAMGLICTKAFGMGIDVSDIKHVVHFAPTGTLADYVQEIGRAARNSEIQGIAHIDYFNGDLRYVCALNGISEMRQYQLKEMLKKLYAIYSVKKHRNLLISSETFEYLFKDGDFENRTKTGLMLLSKDLSNKYSFPVLIVRPKPMLSQNYVCVPTQIEDIFLSKYGKYAKKQPGLSSRKISSGLHNKNSDIQVYSIGDIYLLDMAHIWEEFHSDMSFGMFKKTFFEKEISLNGSSYRISPRVRVEIRYADDFSEVLKKIDDIMNAICNIFAKYKHSESKQFTQRMFEEDLFEALGTKIVSHEKFSLLLDIFSENVDENAVFTQSRSQVRILRKRKQPSTDETAYFVGTTNYFSAKNLFIKYITQCTPNVDNNVFVRFYPYSKDKPIEIMPLLSFMEIIGLATYETRGGEKAEVFVRINDPEKICRLANTSYENKVLQSIKHHHADNQKLLQAFFTTEMDTDERWDLIEEYFLGNNDFVESKLGLI